MLIDWPGALIWTLIFMPIHGLGITVFLHRWGSHRSFKCPSWVSNTGVMLGYLAFQGSPLGWFYSHRVHHQTVDTIYDLHSPKTKGIFHAFIGWLFVREATEEMIKRQVPDHWDNKFFRYLGDKTFPDKPLLNLAICIGFRLFLWVLFGPEVALASLIAGVIIFISPLLINTICHLPQFGYRRFNTLDESRNVKWLLPITYGEALHNSHHFKPRRANNSYAPGELDPSYWFIVLLERLGLAWDVVR